MRWPFVTSTTRIAIFCLAVLLSCVFHVSPAAAEIMGPLRSRLSLAVGVHADTSTAGVRMGFGYSLGTRIGDLGVSLDSLMFLRKDESVIDVGMGVRRDLRTRSRRRRTQVIPWVMGGASYRHDDARASASASVYAEVGIERVPKLVAPGLQASVRLVIAPEVGGRRVDATLVLLSGLAY